ncbi:hypothetical protein NDU88_003622 [Pleurodeles waltl]|uniref:Secreted protein n=1 Tax=Pleurodeles waltl TaxID=8319 RepID=A0AAV7M4T9_PLEWA|nr:hypothetical protein NDU88_003622 [Pleurodeles waltl]
MPCYLSIFFTSSSLVLAGRGQARDNGRRELSELRVLPGLSGSLRGLGGQRRTVDRSAELQRRPRSCRSQAPAPWCGAERCWAWPTWICGLPGPGEWLAWPR